MLFPRLGDSTAEKSAAERVRSLYKRSKVDPMFPTIDDVMIDLKLVALADRIRRTCY